MADQSILASQQLFCNAAMYRIRVSRLLPPEWSDRLQGMRMETVENQEYGPVTELKGVLVDQAALMGVLTHLYEYRIALISVEFCGFGSLDC